MASEIPGPYSIGSDLWPGLSRLTEESGEVIQVIGKMIGGHGENSHYDGTDLRDCLTLEIADLLAAISFVVDKNDLNWAWINERRDMKRDTYERWHAEGRALTGEQSR